MTQSTGSLTKPEDSKPPSTPTYKGVFDDVLNIRRDTNLDQTQAAKQLELARKTSDPLSLSDYRTRMASIESKLVAIANDPEYPKLSDDGKVYLRNQVYDRWLAPTRKEAGLDPIDRGEFLRRTIDVSHLDPSEQFSPNWEKTGIRIGESFFSGAGELIHAGMKYAHSQWTQMHTGAYDYAYLGGNYAQPNYSHSWDEGFNRYVEGAFNWAENKLQRSRDIDDYWLDTHPANSYTSRFLGMSGYLAGQLPFFDALGGVVEAGVAGAAGTAEAFGAGKLATNLTEALTKTRKGQLVAKALRGAAEGYMMGTIEEKDAAGKGREAAMWAGQNLVFGALGMGLTPAFAGARRFVGKILAQGGLPLMRSMIDGAFADAFDQHLGIDIRPEANFQVPRVGVDKQYIWTPLREKDIADIEVGGPHSHMLGDVAVSPHSSFPEAGHLIYDGKIYPYSNLKEMQSQYNYLAKIAEGKRAKADPVLHETNGAAEHMIRELCFEMFGHRNIKGLEAKEAGQLSEVLSYLTNKVAAEEVPIHAPEVVEQEQESAIQQHNQKNPVAAKWDATFKKAGVTPSKAVTKNIVENAKKRAGVKNADRTVAQVGAVRSGIKATREYVPAEGETAGFSLEEALGPETMKALRKARLENLGKIDDAKDQGIAYFRNPKNKGYVPDERRAADGTLIGKRDKRTWHERMSDINTQDFVDSLPLGPGLDFEDGAHKILFHWGNRGIKEGESESTKGLTRKMAHELRKAYETPNRKLTYADFDRASDLLGRHLIQLAKTNNLQADGSMKIFKSSNFFDQPTIWQAELDSDVEKMEYQLLGHMLQHFPDVRDAMVAVMDGLQNKRAATYNVEDWLTYNRMIDSLMTGDLTPEMKTAIEGAIPRRPSVAEEDYDEYGED